MLWEYNSSAIFTRTKKYPIMSEYFIWESNSIIQLYLEQEWQSIYL